MNLYRTIFTAAGFFCVALGAIALLIPLVPTTPFILLGGVCLARGSQRHREWLQRLPLLRRYWPSDPSSVSASTN
jgi:uncharacterized membrane protein YbaN (DUF454 family)